MGSKKIIAKDGSVYAVEFDDGGDSGTLNGVEFEWDVSRIDDKTLHIIKDNKSYNLEVLDATVEDKLFLVSVNGHKHEFRVKDKFDELLHSLGMDSLASAKVLDLKAPMPGLVLDVSTSVGETVKKGDPLLVLEAMKMENIIKSPTDGIIEGIAVEKGDVVEKNELLLNFQ